jgi:aspartyl-tRNA(Asn)/glutamyl-tRNA(Gln) amidotransferase subunit C
MMKITKQEVLHVAHLARLEIDESAVERFAGQIGDILAYVDQLRQVDTAGVRPTSHALALTNAFRDDVEARHLPREKSLANAPRQEDGNFLVPKVVG